jgi:hypothetical protein
LEKYEKLRGDNPSDEGFCFVGPEGFPFPTEAEARFCETYTQYWQRLYGNGAQGMTLSKAANLFRANKFPDSYRER